jgi:class 3 adenylate cyclase/YHS domain-containing protein
VGGEVQTFLFADLAGFTALTEAHGDERAADLIDDFLARARPRLPPHGATEVKCIGDALMIRADRADEALKLAVELATEVGGRHGFPGIRVGAHTGAAVAREDDFFGAAVNLASRVSGAARAGEVLATADTRAAAGEIEGLAFQARGRRPFKGVREPIELYAIQPAGAVLAPAHRVSVDPVCHMSVEPERAAARRDHRGVEYLFCSESCALAFDEEPEHFHRQRSSRSELRVSDNARERAAGFLRSAYRRGRLEAEELEERLAHVFVARTRADLDSVMADLPGRHRLRRRPIRLLPWRRGRRRRPRFRRSG